LIDHGRIGIGSIIKDHVRNVLAAQSTKRNCFLEPAIAEAKACNHIRKGSMLEMGIFDIILKGEALQIVNAVK
jgi:hypothetical protein